MPIKRNFILASASPRRVAMLKDHAFEFEVRPADVDEHFNNQLSILDALADVALQKARAVFQANRQEVVLAADTIVVCDNEILGKPKDVADGYRILSKLSNRTHQVITGLCIISDEGITQVHDITDVSFYKLSDAQIYEYLADDEPYDKAGAYAIQGKASVFVKSIVGDYHNVMGLPLKKTVALLAKQGINRQPSENDDA